MLHYWPLAISHSSTAMKPLHTLRSHCRPESYKDLHMQRSSEGIVDTSPGVNSTIRCF